MSFRGWIRKRQRWQKPWIKWIFTSTFPVINENGTTMHKKIVHRCRNFYRFALLRLFSEQYFLVPFTPNRSFFVWIKTSPSAIYCVETVVTFYSEGVLHAWFNNVKQYTCLRQFLTSVTLHKWLEQIVLPICFNLQVECSIFLVQGSLDSLQFQ